MNEQTTDQIIEVKPVDTQGIAKEEAKVLKIAAIASEVTISTQNQYEDGADMLKAIKAKAKQLDTSRKAITIPIDQAKKAVMDLFRRPLEMLADAEKTIKTAMISFTNEQERIRQEEQTKLEAKAEADRKKKEEQERAWREKEEAKRAEADKLESEGNVEEARKAREQADKAADKAEERSFESDNVVAPVAAQNVDKVAGVSYREDWYAEVVDFTVLKDDFKVADMTKLNKLAKAVKNTMDVPGVVFKSRKILASR